MVFGWLFNVSFSLGLVYASTWLVVNVAPEAAGGGVAGGHQAPVADVSGVEGRPWYAPTLLAVNVALVAAGGGVASVSRGAAL